MLLAMAGIKERYSVQYSDGRIYSVVAQSYAGAKKEFQKNYVAKNGTCPVGQCLTVWPQSDPTAKRNMRTTPMPTKRKRPAPRISTLED